MLRSDSGAAVKQDSAEIGAFRAKVRADLTGVFKPKDAVHAQIMGSPNFDLEETRRFMATMARLGYGAPHWPAEHGGMGASVEMAEVIEEELATFEVPNLYPFFVALFPAGAAIIHHGGAEQHARWLPRILRGEEVWCQLFSEPDAGSDLANVQALAVRDGDVWRVSGTKVWAGRATFARWGFLLARTDRDAPKHAGMTTFGLDMSAPGVEVHPMRQMNGSTNFSSVELVEVVIPDTDRIGDVNGGWSVVGASLASERLAVRTSLGLTLERILELASAPGAGTAVARDRLMRLVTDFKIAQWTAERARVAGRRGSPGPGASMGKLQVGRLLMTLARLSMDVRGATELAWEGAPTDWQLDFLTSPANSLRGGTDEIQKNIMAERDLGLPREPRPA